MRNFRIIIKALLKYSSAHKGFGIMWVCSSWSSEADSWFHFFFFCMWPFIMTNNNCTNFGQLHFVIKLSRNLCSAENIWWLITHYLANSHQFWCKFEKIWKNRHINSYDKLQLNMRIWYSYYRPSLKWSNTVLLPWLHYPLFLPQKCKKR